MIHDSLKSLKGNSHYINRYFKFIEWCRVQTNEGYTEGHHILPRSLFKQHESDAWNIIEISARQHFIAHIMLAKAYGGSMWAALHMMSQCNEDGRRVYQFNSKTYSTMKTEYAKALSEIMKGSGNPMYGRVRAGELNPMFGKKHSPVSIAKQSVAISEYYSRLENRLVGEKNGMFGQTHSDEWKLAKSESMSGEGNPNFGKPVSDARKAKLSAAMTGRVLTDEHKAKVAEATKGKKKTNGAKLSEARKDLRRVYTLTSFICVHKDSLSQYFYRDGKYYDYDAYK